MADPVPSPEDLPSEETEQDQDEFEPDVLTRHGWSRANFIARDRLVMRTIEGVLEHFLWDRKYISRLNTLILADDVPAAFRAMMSEKAYSTLHQIVDAVQRRAGVPKALRAHPLDFAEEYRTLWKRKTLLRRARERSALEFSVTAFIRFLQSRHGPESRQILRRVLSCENAYDPSFQEMFSERHRQIASRSNLGALIEEARYRILVSRKNPALVALRRRARTT